ncbi:IucA/IucC family protein [Paenibacillus sp. SN-8-1]|uniref:IucA/IucC family protein n=1 Tax=Paenibacillus sp. SN-8-1 TaxID=3435409 RepID=UPI003D9A5BDC
MKQWIDEWVAQSTSSENQACRRRVLRQLMESMVHEGILHVEIAKSAGSSGDLMDKLEYRVIGQDGNGDAVLYTFHARDTGSFGRIRILSPIYRIKSGSDSLKSEVISIAQLLQELSIHYPSAEAERLSTFAQELERTLVNDAFHNAWNRQSAGSDILDSNIHEPSSLTEWEAYTSTGHPYHPSYKSRIGFSLEDHLSYAPEFGPSFHLVWVAVHRSYAEAYTLSTLSYEEYIVELLGEEQKRQFDHKIISNGLDPSNYLLTPVHPWQWENKITMDASELIRSRMMIPLGTDCDLYQPLQSIRTLANITNPVKPYVKTSLQIVNTSALRVIGIHHVRNAPAISEWLHQLHREDVYLREECGVIILRETAAVALRYNLLPEPLSRLLEGSMSTVYRESLEPLLEADEQAVPYTFVTHLSNNVPEIDAWIDQFGAENWVQRLLEVTMQPMLHLLYAYGVGLESHGQNMILIHKNGWPERIALRDLPGGIRCLGNHHSYKNRLPLPSLALRPGESSHPILADTAQDVRDFWVDAFLHIQLYEIAVFMTEQYGFTEQQFWSMVGDVVQNYQSLFPQLERQFDLFDLAAETFQVGQLTLRKIYGEGDGREHTVPNPLHSVLSNANQLT